MENRTPAVTAKSNKTRKRTKRKNENHVKTSARVIAWAGMAMAAGQDVHAREYHGPRTKERPGARGKGTENMTRNIQWLIALATLAVAASLHAEPTPSADRTSSKKANKVANQKPQPKTNAAPKMVPAAPLLEGWNYVKGEWIHSDGYKYVNSQVVRTGAQTHRRPPKPPSKSLLNSVKSKPTPTPDPNSAAAKAAERERNMRPRPASQTGSHL